jgi:hypothetical protein
VTTTCERKTRYATEGLAQKSAIKRSRETGDVIQPYLCSQCGGWHIGHPRLSAPRSSKRQGRRR